jgi:hypothetical protein
MVTMKVSLFHLPSIGSRAEMEQGRAGRRGDLSTLRLGELAEQAVLADEVGYDSIKDGSSPGITTASFFFL